MQMRFRGRASEGFKAQMIATGGATALVDFGLWLFSAWVAGVFRLDFQMASIPFETLTLLGIGFGSLFASIGSALQLYARRYVTGSLEEILASLVPWSITSLAASLFVYSFGRLIEVPRSVGAISGAIALLLILLERIVRRVWTSTFEPMKKPSSNTLVLGANSLADAFLSQVRRGGYGNLNPLGILDDDPANSNLEIRGVRVLGPLRDLEKIVHERQVLTVVSCLGAAPGALSDSVVNLSRSRGIDLVVLEPGVIRPESRANRLELRNLSILDLVGRPPVDVNWEELQSHYRGKTILITGAGGSIGGLLTQLVASMDVAQVVAADRDETSLLDVRMANQDRNVMIREYLVDLRDTNGVDAMLAQTTPDIVFHAAALKHVSALENFPQEAWKTNVEGTQNLLRAAAMVGVEKFVNISTDKAADPVNYLGKSKRIAEMLTAGWGLGLNRDYVSVRFGNVIGSRGSLVPIVQDRIARGLPVEITSEDVTRFFMSLDEACKLVLQAGSLGKAGDILVLDMGEPVKIVEVVHKLMSLMGRTVPIKVTGLRDGEKLHETLVGEDEVLEPTSHPRVMRTQSRPISETDLTKLKW